MDYERGIVRDLTSALQQPAARLQVVIGPRQVGKTTAALQVRDHIKWPSIYEAADIVPTPGGEWIETHWNRARKLGDGPKLLILDEVQKINQWSTTVKRLWDEDQRNSNDVNVLLLGSSALQLQQGMSESLAGRFFLHRCTHWSYPECREAFGWNLDQWIYFGGYPGAASYIHDEDMWSTYISDSLIEAAIAKDVLQWNPVRKPALLRELFAVACTHPAQIYSYNKILGQLQDAGNTTTLANYLTLLEQACLLSGLPLFSPNKPRQRSSSPKLFIWNNALVSAFTGKKYDEARTDGSWWGRLVENAVGGHLLNGLSGTSFQIAHWRDRADEMDLVVHRGNTVCGLEVKSGRPRKAAGIEAFRARFPEADVKLIGSGGIPLEEFFSSEAQEWIS